MTRTAIYSLQDNTLTEISDYGPPPDRPNIRNYSSSQQEMYQRHLEAWQIVMQGYNANKEQYEKTLRTIPAHESARSLWKDGQKLTEGVDYTVQLSCSGEFEICAKQFKCDKCTLIAIQKNVQPKPSPLAHIGAGDIRESEDELWREMLASVADIHSQFSINIYKLGYPQAGRILLEESKKIQQKYIITKR